MTDGRLSVLIPDDLKARAKAKAALEHTTLSDVIRAFVEAWVEGELETPAGPKDEALNN